jgi:pimeloyl-ACP methyl ester carboxylesterase
MERTVTLVILPGLDGSDVFFRPFLASLPPHIRPVVIPYPQSGPNDYEALLRLVREKIADIPDFFLLGSSFSGPLAITLAATEPARVRAVILSATFLRAPKPSLIRYRFAAVGPVIWTLRAIRRLPIWLGRRRDDPFRRAKAETWKLVSARCLAARARAALNVDVRDAWRSCTQPALCIIFQDDRVVPRHNADEILHHRPSTELVTVPGDHLAMCKDHGGWTLEIVRFIDKMSGEQRKP